MCVQQAGLAEHRSLLSDSHNTIPGWMLLHFEAFSHCFYYSTRGQSYDRFIEPSAC